MTLLTFNDYSVIIPVPMSEKLKSRDLENIEQKLARKKKKFLAILTASSIFIMGTIYEGGFRFYDPGTKPEVRSYSRMIDPNDGNVFVNTEKYLVMDPIEKENTQYYWIHRGGNSIEVIDKIVKENKDNKQRLDLEMDVRIVNDELLVEHGTIKEAETDELKIQLTIDPNEAEFSFKERPTFEQIIEHVASVSTFEKPIAVNIDMKEPTKFSKANMKEMIKILEKYNVAAIIQPKRDDVKDELRGVVQAETGQNGKSQQGG
jgi:hypothetical protein